MADVTLCLAFHCHQPVGNFEHVIADSFARCYRPMLEVLAEHPSIRFALHWSGILFDWAEQHEDDTLALLRMLVDRGQVELLGGGYYEPLLPLLTPEDARDQLQAQQDYITAHFGQTPTGFWLTERVWEPQLPSVCAGAGLRYTMTDDTHFRAAGLPPDTLLGYYLTEDDGRPLAVFPVDKTLRYAIPFHSPNESVRRLREIADRYPGSALTYGDDGEKFGLWPGTYDWVYTERYLHHLCEALEAASDWLATEPPGAVLAAREPTGRVYLPTATYDEMETWVLGPDSQRTYDELMHAKLPPGQRRFLRGGFFRNFLAKYPEANRMHKRMLAVSHRVRALGPAATDEMRRELWQGQCSCPYWHGLFGGLYLNGIRQAIHHHCIRAGALADAEAHPQSTWVEVEADDLDCDGQDEIGVRSSAFELWIHPSDGGTVSVFDDRQTARMLTDVLTRRPEVYHETIETAEQAAADGTPKSIHDLAGPKESGLSKLLVYDAEPRTSFRDRVLGAANTLQEAMAAQLPHADWATRRYAVSYELDHAAAEVQLVAEAPLLDGGPPVPLTKTFHVNDAARRVEVRYRLAEPATGRVRFATEMNFTLLAADAPDRRLELWQGERCHTAGFGDSLETEGVTAIALIDEWARSTLRITCTPAATLWHYPIQTVSNSEAGCERTYQGTSFVVVWDWELASGPPPSLALTLESHD